MKMIKLQSRSSMADILESKSLSTPRHKVILGVQRPVQFPVHGLRSIVHWSILTEIGGSSNDLR